MKRILVGILLVIGFFSHVLMASEVSIKELISQGWPIEEISQHDEINVSDINIILQLRNGSYIINNPDETLINYNNGTIKTNVIHYDTKGKMKYEKTDFSVYNDGLIRTIDWDSDSVYLTSYFQYDVDNKLIEYSIFNKNDNKVSLLERYVYTQNIICIYDLLNDLKEVLVLNKTKNELICTLYRAKEKDQLYIVKFSNSGLVDSIESTLFTAVPSVARLEYVYDDLGRLIEYKRKSIKINLWINDIKFYYNNEKLVRSYDSCTFIESIYTKHTNEGNWTEKKVVEKNNILAKFTREFSKK